MQMQSPHLFGTHTSVLYALKYVLTLEEGIHISEIHRMQHIDSSGSLKDIELVAASSELESRIEAL